ncbi:MAG TPA: 30S ribosomal protein S16 [Bacteroidales bacterium]|nr:30S ribosomal protein S16 [Bacteroidales bacterium]
MPVKIRLSKKGRKKLPFYHIVVADSRAPRDGKFVERIGLYNPQTNPATIELNFDSALDWLQKGAQPTDTCRAILSEKGVMMKKHLLEGAKKGAFTAEEAEVRFQKWLGEKQAKVKAQMDSIVKGKDDESSKRLAAETKVKEAKAQELAKKLKAQAEETKAVEPVEEIKAVEPVEEIKAVEPVEEIKAVEPVEKPVAEATEEAAPEKPGETTEV